MRHKLAKWLISLGLRLEGDTRPATREEKLALDIPLDAVVETEVDELSPQWTPEQHGNVIVAEPELMTLHRRGKI